MPEYYFNHPTRTDKATGKKYKISSSYVDATEDTDYKQRISEGMRYLDVDRNFLGYLLSKAYEYKVDPAIAINRASIEGILQQEWNNQLAAIERGEEYELDLLSKRGDLNTHDVFGLDLITEELDKNEAPLKHAVSIRKSDNRNQANEKGQGYIPNMYTAVELLMSAIKARQDYVDKHFPGLDEDARAYAVISKYNMGNNDDYIKRNLELWKQGDSKAFNNYRITDNQKGFIDYVLNNKEIQDIARQYSEQNQQQLLDTGLESFYFTKSNNLVEIPTLKGETYRYSPKVRPDSNKVDIKIEKIEMPNNSYKSTQFRKLAPAWLPRQNAQFGLGGNSTYGTKITESDISNSEVGGGQMVAGSALKGAASGALGGLGIATLVGSAVPGIGTAIGALVGLLGGLFGGFGKAKRVREEAARLKEEQRIQTIHNMDTKLENDVYLTRQTTDQSKVNNLGFQMKYGGRIYRPIFANGGSPNKIKVNVPLIATLVGKNPNISLNSEERARYDLIVGNYNAMGEGMADYAYRHGEEKNLDQGDWNEYLPKYREMVSNIQTKIEDDINMFRPTEEGDDKTTFAITTDYQMPYGGIVPNSGNTLVAYGQRHEQYDPQTGETGVPYNDIEVEGGGMIGNKALAGEVIKQTPTGDLVFSDRLRVPNTKYTYADVAKHISDKKGAIEKDLTSTIANLDKALSLVGKSRTTFAKRGTQQRNIEKLATQVNMGMARLQELDSQLNDVYTTQEEHATMLGLRDNDGSPVQIMACGGRRVRADGGGFFGGFGLANGIGLGAQLLYGIGNYLSNRGMAKAYANMAIPLQTKETAPIYEWRYNVGNEIEDINRQVRTANNYVTRNVSNAQVARNLVSQNVIQGARARGQVYAKQNQIEQQGRNRNILARYETNRANAQKMYQNAVDKYNQQVTALGMRQQANQTLTKDLMGVVQGGLNLYAQKYAIDKLGDAFPKAVQNKLNGTSGSISLANSNPTVSLPWTSSSYINPYTYLRYGAGNYRAGSFKVPSLPLIGSFQ